VSPTLTSAVKTAEQLAPRLKALADVHRLTIVLLLADRAMSVKQLHEEMDLGQTLVSHHLAILRRAGLVRAEPQGRSNIYQLCCEALTEPVRTIASLADGPST
jgi:DNA-binding transcriptional ArsR family regulator